MKWWDQMPWSFFFECWVLSQLFHSFLWPSSRGSLVPLHFLPLGRCHLHIWGYWYFSRHLDSSLCFTQSSTHMMYSAHKLDKQGDNIQPWCTPFPILNQFIVPCLVLTVASWPEYRFRKLINISVSVSCSSELITLEKEVVGISNLQANLKHNWQPGLGDCHLKWGQTYGTESLTYGIWCYLQVVSEMS